MTAPAAPDPDSIATVLLTTRLALPESASGSPKPLGPNAYASLRERLAERMIAPGTLIGFSSDRIASMLDLESGRAENVAALLARAGSLSLALDRLAARGIWFLDQATPGYPRMLVERLGSSAPPVLFGSGDPGLMAQEGLAIVGSRDVDEALSGVAAQIATNAALGQLGVVSGGARGVDAIATSAALEAGGRCVGVVADSLEQRLRERETRRAVADGNLLVLSPYGPSVPFSRGLAMGRNKLIYCLSCAAIVVSSSWEKGGTWAGAVEAIEKGWVPVLAWTGAGALPGNKALVARGARELDDESFENIIAVTRRSNEAGRGRDAAGAAQETLFGSAEPLVARPPRPRRAARG